MAKTPTNAPPPFVRAAERPPAPQDKLDRLREKVKEARDTEREIADLTERLSKLNERVQSIFHKELPDLFDEIGTDKFAIPADGNLPAYDAKLEPYYAANIAASWPPEKRMAAFDWLENHGHGDLIKTDVAVALPREQRKKADQLVSLLQKKGYDPAVKEAVHPSTLKAWLREQVEANAELPPLDLIGGTVGRVVKLKERR